MAKMPREPGENIRAVRLRLLDDGRISNDRMEIFAVMLTDPMPFQDAWKAASVLIRGKPPESVGDYRQRIMAHVVFKGRVAVLEAERERNLGAGLIGEALHTAKQFYRLAIAKGDLSAVGQASRQVLEATKLVSDEKGAQPPAPGGAVEKPAGPGRPSVTTRTGVDISEIRTKLMARGLPSPGDEVADVVADEAAA